MSEYQYYEFLALDRPLTAKQQAQVRALSSRVRPTPFQAIFTYSYGDFRGDPLAVLAQHFDLMLYLANWGSRQLAFRLPRAAVDPDALRPYSCAADEIEVTTTADHVILSIAVHEEEGLGWIEGEGHLSVLAPLRAALVCGDWRVLYLAWLKAAAGHAGWLGEDEDDQAIDGEDEGEDWADDGGADEDGGGASDEPQAAEALRRRLRGLGEVVADSAATGAPRRSLATLLSEATVRRQARRAHTRREAEAARWRHLSEIAQQEPALWAQVTALIEQKTVQAYDKAVAILVELRALADDRGQTASFAARLEALRQAYQRRPGLLQRLRQAKLA